MPATEHRFYYWRLDNKHHCNNFIVNKMEASTRMKDLYPKLT